MCLAANFSVSIFRVHPKYRAVWAAYIFSACSKNENTMGRDTHSHITMLNINNECYLHIYSKITIWISLFIFLLLCVTASSLVSPCTLKLSARLLTSPSAEPVSLSAPLLVPLPSHTVIQALLPVLNPLSSAAGSITSAPSPLVNTQVYNRENV